MEKTRDGRFYRGRRIRGRRTTTLFASGRLGSLKKTAKHFWGEPNSVIGAPCFSGDDVGVCLVVPVIQHSRYPQSGRGL